MNAKTITHVCKRLIINLKFTNWKTTIIFVFLFCSSYASAYAGLIRFEFTGIIQRVDDQPMNIKEAAIRVGDTISGFITFDTNTIDSNPIDTELGEYYMKNLNAGLVFNFGSQTLGHSELTPQLYVRDRTCGDGIDFNCSPTGTFDQQITFSAFITGLGNFSTIYGWNPDNMVWGLSSFMHRVLQNDSVPNQLTLSDWDNGGSWRVTGNGTKITGNIISLRQIPEPATLALLTLGLAGLGFSRRRRAAF